VHRGVRQHTIVAINQGDEYDQDQDWTGGCALRDGYRYEQDMTAAISKTEDAKEAQRAFAEKRPPVFVGR